MRQESVEIHSRSGVQYVSSFQYQKYAGTHLSNLEDILYLFSSAPAESKENSSVLTVKLPILPLTGKILTVTFGGQFH